jgi:hypothetical protein
VIDVVGLGLVVFTALLLALLTRLRRKSPPRLRPITGLARLYRAFGLSVEDGTRLLLGLGAQSFLSRHAAAGLAGLALLREVSQKASVSDRPPVSASGDAALALLSQDSLHAGYRVIGAAEYYQPSTGRLAGLTPFSAAASTMSMVHDEDVSAVALVGHYGMEAALLSEAADRSNATILGASSDPAAQAALYATASDALIGEELYAAPAYFSGRPTYAAGLSVQDVLRWLIIIGLVIGAVLKILGIF